MPGISFQVAMILIILFVVLGLFSNVLADTSKSEAELGKLGETSERFARQIIPNDPSVNLRSCIAEQGRDFTYNFLVTGLNGKFEGLPGAEDLPMPVFVTLGFKDEVVRDKNNKVVTLTEDQQKDFGELEFTIKTGIAPYKFRPDESANEDLGKGQSLIVNNYRITLFQQSKLFGKFNINPASDCYTTFQVECGPGFFYRYDYIELASCEDDSDSCQGSLPMCDGRVNIDLTSYRAGSCGSRPANIVVQTSKKAEKWNYEDEMFLNFWRHDPKERPLENKDGTKEYCWQQKLPSKECEAKFLGWKRIALTPAQYNVEGCTHSGVYT